MKRIVVVTSVHEPEIDMTRASERTSGSRLRRLLGSLVGNLQALGPLGTPRRSIDREQQQYSPLND
jgi:hypothetical protein